MGIDVNAEMLALVRRHAPSVAGDLAFFNTLDSGLNSRDAR
jgi:hypothetical protein